MTHVDYVCTCVHTRKTHDKYFLHRRRLAVSDGSRIFETICVESRLLFRNSPRNKTFVPHTVYNNARTRLVDTRESVVQVAPDRPCIIIVVPYEFGPAPRLISVSRNHYQALIGLPGTLGTFNDIVRFANSQHSRSSLHYSHKFTTVLRRFSRQITRRLYRCFRMVLLCSEWITTRGEL